MSKFIKSCPFCGGKVYPVYSSIDERFRFRHYAKSGKKCIIDEILLKRRPNSFVKAIDGWNKRAKE